jgi:hypothetical protein
MFSFSDFGDFGRSDSFSGTVKCVSPVSLLGSRKHFIGDIYKGLILPAAVNNKDRKAGA